MLSCGSAPSVMRVGLNLKYRRALSSSVPTMASDSTPSDFSRSDVVAICASARRQNGQYNPGKRPRSSSVLSPIVRQGDLSLFVYRRDNEIRRGLAGLYRRLD